MSDPGQPVTADTATMTALVDDFETGASGMTIEDLAQDRGVTFPDSRDGWHIVYRWGPEGQDYGLYWVHPDNEPIQQID